MLLQLNINIHLLLLHALSFSELVKFQHISIELFNDDIKTLINHMYCLTVVREQHSRN